MGKLKFKNTKSNNRQDSQNNLHKENKKEVCTNKKENEKPETLWRISRETRSSKSCTESIHHRFTRSSVPVSNKEDKELPKEYEGASEISKEQYNNLLCEKDGKEESRTDKASNYYKSYDPNALDNLSFVLTGVLSVTRDSAMCVIRKHGGYPMLKVDTTTDYVVMGDKVGHTKTNKAKEFKIPTISEDQLFNLLRGGKSLTLTDPDTVRKRFPNGPPTFNNPRRPKKRRVDKFEFDEEGDDDDDDDGWYEEEDDKQIASIIQSWGREEALLYLIQDILGDNNFLI